jgi:hypothetical protein
MTDAWETLEAVIHRWARESTGIDPTRVYWPGKGQTRPAMPYCALELTNMRTLGPPGTGHEAETAASWLITVTEPEGTNSLAVYTDDAETPSFEATSTTPAETTLEEARDALLDELADLPDGLDAEAVDDASIRVTAAEDGVMFWLASDELGLDLESAATTRFTHTATAYTLQLDLHASATAGANSASRLATTLLARRRLYSALLQRCGWRFGAVVANRAGYLDDSSASRSIVEIELLGVELVADPPSPTLRRPPAFTGQTTTVIVGNAQ